MPGLGVLSVSVFLRGSDLQIELRAMIRIVGQGRVNLAQRQLRVV
jgi:hypothetical protein